MNRVFALGTQGGNAPVVNIERGLCICISTLCQLFQVTRYWIHRLTVCPLWRRGGSPCLYRLFRALQRPRASAHGIWKLKIAFQPPKLTFTRRQGHNHTHPWLQLTGIELSSMNLTSLFEAIQASGHEWWRRVVAEVGTSANLLPWLTASVSHMD